MESSRTRKSKTGRRSVQLRPFGLIFFILMSCGTQNIVGVGKRHAPSDQAEQPSSSEDAPDKVGEQGSDSARALPKSTFAAIPPNGKYAWRPLWNLEISEAVQKFGTNLLDNNAVPKADVVALCPGFFAATNSEKSAFWALFISSIARFESGFNPSDRFQENGSLNYIYSEGLLQLSYGDEKIYPNCKLNKKEQNILDPKVNLQCGVGILSAQVKARKTLFPESYFYWSVLSDKKSKIQTDFLKSAAQLKFCTK